MTFGAYKTELGSLKLKSNKFFHYYIDFSDNWWHKIRVVSVKTPVVKDRKYPYVASASATVPSRTLAATGGRRSAWRGWGKLNGAAKPAMRTARKGREKIAW